MILLVVIHPEQDKMAPNSRRPCVRFQPKKEFYMRQDTKKTLLVLTLMLAPLPALAQSADTAKPTTTGTGMETPTTNAITGETTDTTKTGASATGTGTDSTGTGATGTASTGTGSTGTGMAGTGTDTTGSSTTGTSTDSTGTSTTAGMSTNRNNGFDYSWLGLLGLLGLAGLRRPAPTAISQDRVDTTRRA